LRSPPFIRKDRASGIVFLLLTLSSAIGRTSAAPNAVVVLLLPVDGAASFS
jgi:hypothetical protein